MDVFRTISCPQCRMPLSRRQLQTTTDNPGRVTCPSCSALLRFDPRPLVGVALAAAAAGVICGVATGSVGSGFITFIIVFGIVAMLPFFDRLIVVEHGGNPRFCPDCGYELRGTLAAGRTQCPECGRAIHTQAGKNHESAN